MRCPRLLPALTILLLGALAPAAPAPAQSVAAPSTRALSEAACRTEVRQLHEFFQAWYRGDLEPTDEAFARFAGVLAAEFTVITTGGLELDRDRLLPLMRGEHGTKPDLEMWTENFRLRLADCGLVLFTYEEHGRTAGRRKASLITALLRENPAMVNGLEWVHLHEVDLPTAG